MSEESVEKIKEQLGDLWEQSERDQDPVALWKTIKVTHTAYNTGALFFDQSSLNKGYNEIKMLRGETLISLKTRMTTALKATESLGMIIPDDVQQAQDFIEKLDQRFRNLRSTLENAVTMERDTPPKNLLEAFRLASKWKVEYTTPDGNVVTTFATSAYTPKPNGGEKGKNDGKKGTRDEKGGSKNEKKKMNLNPKSPGDLVIYVVTCTL